MDLVKDGWFSEISDLWPGQCFSLKVKEILYKDKSDYQDILIFESTNNGTALVLDGIVQCTQKDEFSYQEMITFLPLCNHANPQRVLIVGGGDGGVAREVQKHPLVKEIIQVEIDEKVVNASKKHLPFMAKGFESPKVALKICDGFEYMKNHKNEFDVIITDSSDPIGPAVNLFTEPYYKLLKEALKPNGVISCQAGTFWSDLPHVKQTMGSCKKHFKSVIYAYCSVPSYPDGQIGYLVATKDENNDLRQPNFKFTKQQLQDLDIKYYNDEVHSAAFVLPNFVKIELSKYICILFTTKGDIFAIIGKCAINNKRKVINESKRKDSLGKFSVLNPLSAPKDNSDLF